MTRTATLFIVCSDLGRNGKTLLARVLTDHLLIEGRDPFCFDLGAPDGALRSFFPGRTALVNFEDAPGRTAFFDRILAAAGRDQVIDVAASRLAEFRDAWMKRGFADTARNQGFQSCMLYIVDRDAQSLQTAIALEEELLPDLFVPVINRFAGSSLPEGVPGPGLVMERLDADLAALIASRRFSLRSFMLGEATTMTLRHAAQLRNFLSDLQTGIREFAPALSLQQLRAVDLPSAKDL
jgi:hypothetical protein